MTQLTPSERAQFVAIADILICGDDIMPAASQANIAGERLDRLLALRPEFRRLLKDALDATRDMDSREAVQFLNAEQPAWFGPLSLLAAAAYFMNQEVRDALNYPGQQRRPVLPIEENDPIDSELLNPVIQRGPIYRMPPK